MSIYDYHPAELQIASPTAPLPLTTFGRILRYALLCGFIGFLVSLRAFAAATLPHILTADGLSYQGVLEGLPTPRLLDWNTTQIALLQQYTDLSPVFLMVGGVLLFGFLWICTLRMLFPSLRLFRPLPGSVQGSEAAVSAVGTSAVALDGRLLVRMGGLFFLVALPLAALWIAAAFGSARFPTKAAACQTTAFMAAGIWLRFALRRGGFVGRGLAPFGATADQDGASFGLKEAGIGAAFGLLLSLLRGSAMRLPTPGVLRSMHALGTFHVARWNGLALHYLLSVGLVCFGAGLLFLIFAPIQTRPFPRMLMFALVALCIPLAFWFQRPYSAQALAANWDITPPIMLAAWPYTQRNAASGVPDGGEAAAELARFAGIAKRNPSSSPDRRFLLFTPAGAFDALLHGYTEDGLTTDLASVSKVEAFLKRRNYETALSWTAFKHIYNVGNVHFDSTMALRACLDDLERSPHANVMTHTVQEMLFTISASPQNLALLNEWADDSRFVHEDRPSLKLMGDLYLRFGEQQKALEWYARAEMPRSFMAERRANKPLFHAGEIEGTLLWNGKPLVGAQVGAFPFLQNGLPKDLEGQVREAERQLMPPYAFSERFGSFAPRPYQFRWMSAGTSTDNVGHFSLSHLTEGTYHLVCTLPAGVTLMPFRDARLHLVHAPGDISLRYVRPTAALGKIELTFHP